MRPPILLAPLITFGLLLTPFPAAADEQERPAYQQQLISQSLDLNLHEKRFWRLLVHYHRNIFGTWISKEDGPDFFASPEGKSDPRKELVATLGIFFIDPKKLDEGDEHPQCNFAARYKWLKRELEFDPEKLPEVSCPRLEGWLKDLDAEKITLVFSSFYMNNPASMFGHTLLRIDSHKRGENQKLLNYGVNYSAAVDSSSNTLSYIFKGLLGYYRGQFSIFPYYTKVQAYSNLESRDLWEYELHFTSDQINYFLRHLWELGGNYFDYLYFQENCSYHLLSLLEVANPELHLTDQFTFHVIPTETIKVVNSQPGLVSKRVYRPSLLSQMNDKRLRMKPLEKKLFGKLSRDRSFLEKPDFLDISNTLKATVLDAYLDLLQFRNMKNERAEQTIDPNTRKVLLMRSRLGRREKSDFSPIEFSSPPELGHGSARFGSGYGRFDGESFQSFSLRPAYHDLLAKETGYSPGSQILFLEINGRYYRNAHKTKVDSVKLIDIISLTPFEQLFRKKSWKLSIAVDTVKDLDCGLCNSFKINYGRGFSFQPSIFSRFMFYSLLEAELELAGPLSKNYRLGGGGVAGAFIKLTQNWKVELRAEYLDFPLGHDSDYYKLNLNQRYALSQNLDARLELGNLKNRKEWLASLNYYF